MFFSYTNNCACCIMFSALSVALATNIFINICFEPASVKNFSEKTIVPAKILPLNLTAYIMILHVNYRPTKFQLLSLILKINLPDCQSRLKSTLQLSDKTCVVNYKTVSAREGTMFGKAIRLERVNRLTTPPKCGLPFSAYLS